MDTTRISDLLTQLGAADPADAPDLADELTSALADALDGRRPEAAEMADRTPESETDVP